MLETLVNRILILYVVFGHPAGRMRALPLGTQGISSASIAVLVRLCLGIGRVCLGLRRVHIGLWAYSRRSFDWDRRFRLCRLSFTVHVGHLHQSGHGVDS